MAGIKWKDLLKIGTGVGKVVLPKPAGSILDAVNNSINDESDPANSQGLRELARVNDEQTEAILALHERLKRLEDKVK